ncbi:MAG: ribonuclease catalytic domain-containing protein, partial [Desulfobacca sp.]|uniref:ribonuclease catalytic domain-containing protein n=1 Tax=Desulfobacca sp. TaxID=2067990 RepID=UPI00404ACC03
YIMANSQVVEFFEDRKIYCAFVGDDRGDRLHVITEQNRELNLPRKRLIHITPWTGSGNLSRLELVEHLKAIGQRRESIKREINLQEIWELLVNEAEGFPLAELARSWFGDAVTADQSAALGRALFEDRFYFKFKGSLWQPHPPEVVEHLKEQYRRELARRQERQAAATWLQAAWEGREITDPSWRQKLVDILRDMAVSGTTSQHYELGKEYLEEAKLNKPDIPFKLLVKMGVFSPDENLDLYRYEAPQEFSPEVQAAALRLSVASQREDPYAPFRLDLVGLDIFTIDGERTRDFDDALSLEQTAEGWRLGVHITDVATHLQPGNLLDQAALERGTSLYLPERRIPMLPETLSENAFSLLAQEERLAVSFLVNLSPAGEILDYRIAPSLIRVGQRLTYYEVDLRIRQEERWATLHRLAARLRERRLRHGGVHLHFPEVMISVDPQGEVRVEIEDMETPSHEIVSEAMILANFLGASFLATHGLPALYRTQAPPREDLVPVGEGRSLLQLWQNRRRLSRVLLEVEPQPHWGLGLAVYTTLSSPIRRYLDIVSQRQLLAALCQQPLPYSREALEELLTVLEPALRRAALLKAKRSRYWLLKYLSQRLGQKMPALVLEQHPNRYRLLLPDLLLETEMPAPSGRQFHPGETILVRVDRAIPMDDVLKVSLA